MRMIAYPSVEEWMEISARPSEGSGDLEARVYSILKEVKRKGDQALIDFTKDFDGLSIEKLQVTPEELEAGSNLVSDALKEAIQKATENIVKFHSAQHRGVEKIETSPGVTCWRRGVPIDKVGLYIPGGSAPLFSTVLMLGIPARIAKCKEVILCTPPNSDGTINPAILYACRLVGIEKIFKVGGAQAVAAMAYGTDTIPKVAKIFGPGNQYVTKAKELVSINSATAIDMPAGPSEVLIIADEQSNPAYVAADLLSQAEHGPDSQVILITTSRSTLDAVQLEIKVQLTDLPRKEIAARALENSSLILTSTLEEAIDLSNTYAPEHLIIATENAEEIATKVTNAGSVFIGKYSCESAGDYASGTNHTLPTAGYANAYSGVSLDSFLKFITFQNIDERGLLELGPAIEIMAEAEGLIAHKNAVSVRLKDLRND